MKTLFSLTFFYVSSVIGGLVPDFGITDTSIPGKLPIWSFVLTTTTCTNTTEPSTVLVQLATGTNGIFVHPPQRQQTTSVMLQDPQVNQMQQLNGLYMTNTVAEDWQVCGLQIQINDALVYDQQTPFTVGLNTTYAITLDQLQADPNWYKTTQICNPPSDFSVQDITNLVLGKIGNYVITSGQPIDWAQDVESNSIQVSSNGNTQIQTLMQYNDGTDIYDFTLTFQIIASCNDNNLNIQSTDILTEVTTTPSNDTINNAVFSAMLGVASTTSVAASFCPSLSVNGDGSISFGWPFGVGNMGALCW